MGGPQVSGMQSGPYIRIPANDGIDLDLSTKTPVPGKDGEFTVKDKNGKSYIMTASGTVRAGTLNGANYSQTTGNKNIDVNVSLFQDKNGDGVKDEGVAELFGANFKYNGTSERLTQDGNDDVKTSTVKNITRNILQDGHHIAGFNTFTGEVKANAKDQNEVHKTDDTTTVRQSPAEIEAMEKAMLAGKVPEASSQIFKTKIE